MRSPSFFCALLFLACRERPPEARSADGAVDASASAPDASSDAATSTKLCGWSVVAGDNAARPLSPNVLPREQRVAGDAGRARRLGYARFQSAPDKPVKTALVVGPAETCDLLYAYDHYEKVDVSGPFAGIASDAAWQAVVFTGRLHIAVALLDGGGIPRAVNIVDTWYDLNADPTTEAGFADQTGTGRHVSTLEAFPSGRSVLLGSYQSGDGLNDVTLRVLHVVTRGDEPELSVVATEKASHEVGRATFEVSVATKGEAPSLAFIHRQREPGLGSNAPVGKPTTRTRRWDAKAMRFR
jgi:hypothetical protein